MNKAYADLIQLLSQGKYNETLEAIGQKRYSPKIPVGRVWEMCGLAHYGLEEITAAIRALEHANTLVPLSLVAQLSLASAYLHEKYPLTAEAIYLHLQSQPATYESKTICTGVAEGLTRLDLHSDAVTVCQRSLLRYPQSHRLNFLCGINTRHDGAPAHVSKDYFRRALAQLPESIHYAIEYAKECLNVDEIQEAEEALEGINPPELQCVAALQRLKLVYEQMNNGEMEELCDCRLRELYYKMKSKY